jgi:hypothetical protein
VLSRAHTTVFTANSLDMICILTTLTNKFAERRAPILRFALPVLSRVMDS